MDLSFILFHVPDQVIKLVSTIMKRMETFNFDQISRIE